MTLRVWYTGVLPAFVGVFGLRLPGGAGTGTSAEGRVESNELRQDGRCRAKPSPCLSLENLAKEPSPLFSLGLLRVCNNRWV